MLKEYEFAARNLPFEIIIPVENTSTMMISPSVYRAYAFLTRRSMSSGRT
jgi:hypothetical protein